MAEDKIEILIVANDKATGELKSVADRVGVTVREQRGLLDSFKTSWVELSSMVNLAAQAFQALKGVYDDVIGGTVAYAEEVRSLSRLIGATPQEASKLIQAADDVKVSYETLSGALEVAIRKGVQPTIEGIGKLADEYRRIEDPIARSKFLMDNFGRSGADLGPLLERGSYGIRQLGEAAEELGLVLDQEAIRKTREYEVAVDELTDQLEGAKVEIGTKLIPVFTQLLKVLGEADYSQGRLMYGTSGLVGKTDELSFSLGRLGEHFGSDYEVGRRKSEELIGVTDALGEAMDGLREDVEGASGAVEDMAADQERAKGIMSELGIFIRGDLGRTMEEYQGRVEDLTKEWNENQAKIRELNSQKLLTEEQRKELEATLEKQREIEQKIKDVKDEWEKQTKSVLFNLLQQQLAVDGLTTAEAEALGGVAEKWGLIDEDTRRAWERIQEYIGGLQGAKIDANELWNEVNGIPSHKDVNLNVNITSTGGWTLSDLQAAGLLPTYYNPYSFAEGADFIVPPGFPNDSFPINVSSGERVIVIPKEEVSRTTGGGEVGTVQKGGGGGGAVFVVNYSPLLSLADAEELEVRLTPLIEEVIRKYERRV